MEKFAIIVAGGSGSRMGSARPKQFMLLDGKPILMHTIEAFFRHSHEIKIILVLPKDSIIEWQDLCVQFSFNYEIYIAVGGSTRFESVKNGLQKIKNKKSLVAIHDGVRPLISEDIIDHSFQLADKKGSAIVSTPIKESIRQLKGETSKAIDRTKLRSIQTPQTFRTGLIKEAFAKFETDQNFTDDASVAEKAGHQVHLIEGSYQNIKITTPEDLLFAEAILRQKKSDK